MSYPDGASGDATVVLTLTIAPDGSVRDAVPTLDVEPFSSAAAAAAKNWRFDPATRAGKAISAKIRFEVTFHAPVPEAPPPEPEANPYGLSPEEKPPPPPPPPPPSEILIRGERVEPSRSATLSRAEVRQIPGTFGDPFRAIEVMPGVTPIVTGLPFFFVRGAPPGNVGYFHDGIKVPLLFHVGVGPSVVHPGIMDRVDLYPGGYPARFGRFSGGIVSGETIAPAPVFHGEYNVRAVDAGGLVEAPFADGRGTLLAAGRYSYTAALLSLLSSDTKLDYWDYQVRATYDVNARDRIGVFAFGSYDHLAQYTPTQTLTLFGTEFHRVDVRYDRRLDENGTLRLAVTGGIDRSRAPGDRYVRDRSIGTRSEITYRLSPKSLLRIGTDAYLNVYDVELSAAEQGLPASTRNAVAFLFASRPDVTVGARADLVLALHSNFEVTPGIRADYFGSNGQTATAVDPRLAARLPSSPTIALLSAMGLAHQPPAFVVPVPGLQPAGLRGGLQQALQESAGLEFQLDEATTLTATGFHNAFFNMSDPLGTTAPTVGGCPPGSFPDTNIPGDRGGQPMGNASCQDRFDRGEIGSDRSGGGGDGADSPGAQRTAQAVQVRTMGTSYGLEIFLKRRLTGRLGGFLSYTLSRSVRSFERRQFTATFDRTHVLNAALAYNLGRNWRAGTRVTFYTGLPKAADPTDDSTRLPPFFRVDLRLEKRWQLSEKVWISMVAEWMNATLSKEAVSTTCNLQGCSSTMIGPVTIPSLGVEGGF
ncbi:MAG: energy transducer TonB [Polyangiaceae bacterium]